MLCLSADSHLSLIKGEIDVPRNTGPRLAYHPMNTPYQGAGTCSFANGAKYQMYIGN